MRSELARIKVIGDTRIQTPESAGVQMRANLGEEMTPIKVMQKELCDGFLHVFNPGEVHTITCDCPDMRHIKQFLTSEFFEVELNLVEKFKLAKIEKAAQ